MKKLTYLAVPYSSPSWIVREDRFNKVNQVACKLMQNGELILSPISHSHPIAKAGNLPNDWKYWADFCRANLSACDKVYVLMLDGWEDSTGVQSEIKIAKELGLEIEYLKFENFTEW